MSLFLFSKLISVWWDRSVSLNSDRYTGKSFGGHVVRPFRFTFCLMNWGCIWTLWSQINERDNNHKLCLSARRGCCQLAAGGWYYLCYLCLVMDDGPGARHHDVMDQGLSLVTVLVTIAVRKLRPSIIITECQLFVIISDDGSQFSSTPSTDNMQVRRGLILRGELRRSSWQWIFQCINFTITRIKEVCVDMVCGLIFVTVGAWSYSGTKALQWDQQIYCSESNTRDRVQPRNPGHEDTCIHTQFMVLRRPDTRYIWQLRVLLTAEAWYIVIHICSGLFSD